MKSVVKSSRPPDVEYGIDWRAKAEAQARKENRPIQFVPSIVRHQYCAYHNVGNGAMWHRRERIKMIWPDYQWHRWNERRLEGESNSNWLTWIGPASSGKSVDAAVFALEYWLQAPHETAIIVCSTTMKMLRKRIWSEIVRFHQALDPKQLGPVGELLDSVTTIRWRQGDDKHAIFGIAVEEGNPEEVINNLVGIKSRRIVLYIDEGQGIREAILKATRNMAKNPIFKFRMMGNPDHLQSPLMKESEPIEGWDSVVRGETEEWTTLGGPVPGNGLCQFFDGRKSPADDSPEERKRLPFLINKDQIADHLKSVRGNLNDPSYWTQCVGWPPPMGTESTLLDDAIMVTFHCKEKAVWTDGFTRCAALDPAFNGGDKAILQFAKYGRSSGLDYDRDTRTWGTAVGQTAWVIEFEEWVQLTIDANSTRPIHYQLLDGAKLECEKRGVRPSEFVIDASGEGGGLRDIMLKEWGSVNGVESGGSPSDRMINEEGKTAKESYDTRATELLLNLREFALANGIRGLSNEAAFQAANRRTFYRNGKWAAEPKVGGKGRTDERGRPVRGFRQRMGFSPDHLDAACLVVEHCKQQGAVPLVSGAAISTEPEIYAPQYDEFSSDNYLRGYNHS